ncbi:MAG: bifunctional diaminohydroxyphosphoribosylaminopyrimidine deaminase/5-amino-6-(5-phosphoribosylamino)uracil reductase RibD [Rhizobiaceae bacterium]|nr:bifunctional diaminohydroxyphosphoribosylaminopyrimidine deaminase/5-amino-6-(5-phosphoribosylamino)uracil reductase RibD [Rhizobiaceae bacterium]
MNQISSENDQRFMAAAIRLAGTHQGLTGTNPSVACVLVKDGRIIATGVTAIGGRPHAEPIALEQCGELAKGSTAYVTLEPCAHHGKTPPCAQALIDAGIERVVTAAIDPDDRVNGKGHAMLKQAGVPFEQGLLSDEAKGNIEGYLTRKALGRPFVTLKLAVTNNGLMGLRGDGQLPITGAVSRSQVHLMRARHDAILVGAATIRTDNPDLTCRLAGMENRSPIRIVLDANLSTSPKSAIVSNADKVPCWIVTPKSGDNGKQNALTEKHCQLIACEIHEGQIALPELLDDLAEKGITSLMVEGGSKVATSFLADGLVDAIELFVGTGAADEKPTDQAILSPVTLDNVPSGFCSVEEWEFINPQSGGFDRQYRFEQI